MPPYMALCNGFCRFVHKEQYNVQADVAHHVVKVRDTRQNAESSRSHQIVRIFVESRPSMPAMPEGATVNVIAHLQSLFE